MHMDLHVVSSQLGKEPLELLDPLTPIRLNVGVMGVVGTVPPSPLPLPKKKKKRESEILPNLYPGDIELLVFIEGC